MYVLLRMKWYTNLTMYLQLYKELWQKMVVEVFKYFRKPWHNFPDCTNHEKFRLWRPFREPQDWLCLLICFEGTLFNRATIPYFQGTTSMCVLRLLLFLASSKPWDWSVVGSVVGNAMTRNETKHSNRKWNPFSSRVEMGTQNNGLILPPRQKHSCWLQRIWYYKILQIFSTGSQVCKICKSVLLTFML